MVSLKRPIVKAYKKSLEKPVKVADSLVEYYPDKREMFCTKFLKPELTYNIDSEKIKQIIRNKIFVEKEVIARGEEAIIDEEAQIVLEVDTEVSSEPLVEEDGSVDFHQISSLKTVEKDKLLAVKIPATKGKDGRSVFDEETDSTGKDNKLPHGKNTYISDHLTTICRYTLL